MERVTDRNASRPLPIPENPGSANLVSANPSAPTGSVKSAEDLPRNIRHFHTVILMTGGDIQSTTDLKRLKILKEMVIEDPVPERDPWDARE